MARVRWPCKWTHTRVLGPLVVVTGCLTLLLIKWDVQRLGDSVSYDVQYTIDPSGQRAGSSVRDEVMSYCVWLFGGSFGFGPGVLDGEPLPFRIMVLRRKGTG